MYRGFVADFPVGRGGLDGNQNFYRVPISNLTIANNIRYDGFAWRKAPGIADFDSNAISGTPTCYGGYDWRPNSALQHQITAWSNGTVHRETSGNIDAADVSTGATFTDPVVFVSGGNLSLDTTQNLYMFSRNVQPYELDYDSGSYTVTNCTNSADWATTFPAAAVYHDSRLFAYDLDSAPHNFYISTLNDHKDFSGDNGAKVFSIAPGFGERIACMYSYLPTLLLAFKYPRGIWQIDTTNVSGYFLPIDLVRDDVGVAGPFAVAKVGADVWFISSNGRVYSLTALRPDIDPQDADITAKLNLTQFIQDNVDLTKLKWARLVYDEVRRELHYVFTSKDGTTNDKALVFDVNEPGNVKVSVENRGEYFNAVWPYLDSSTKQTRLLSGGSAGKVYSLNQSDRNIAGTDAYNSEFQYPETDLGFVDPSLISKQKRFDFVELTVIPTGNYTMSIEIYIDGEQHSTKSINLGSDTAVWDTAVFGTDTFGGGITEKHRVPIEAVGNRISIKGYNTGLNQDFNIANVRLFFSVQVQEFEA